jgi:hypothetical protein
MNDPALALAVSVAGCRSTSSVRPVHVQCIGFPPIIRGRRRDGVGHRLDGQPLLLDSSS